jgi:hypothetical protein
VAVVQPPTWRRLPARLERWNHAVLNTNSSSTKKASSRTRCWAAMLVLFHGDVAHYCPVNELQTKWRWVLFAMFSPMEGADQDEYQQFLRCQS